MLGFQFVETVEIEIDNSSGRSAIWR